MIECFGLVAPGKGIATQFSTMIFARTPAFSLSLFTEISTYIGVPTDSRAGRVSSSVKSGCLNTLMTMSIFRLSFTIGSESSVMPSGGEDSNQIVLFVTRFTLQVTGSRYCETDAFVDCLLISTCCLYFTDALSLDYTVQE